MTHSTKTYGRWRGVSGAVSGGLGWLSVALFASASWAVPELPTPQPTPTATFVPRTCGVGGASGITLNTRLLTITLPLSGVQRWRFGDLRPDNTRGIEIRPGESHFDCTTSTFSGQAVKVCARLDPALPARGSVDCSGGNLAGYHSVMQVDHNTNQLVVGGQPNSGLPADPNCTNTFSAPDGTVLASCLEGTDPACSGGAHTHVGACNSPPEQTFVGVSPAGGFLLSEAIDLSFQIGADCSTPCPPDDAPLQAGELQVAGELTSGEAKGVVWQANNTALTLGTTGTSGCPVECLVPPCCPPLEGTPMGDCIAAPPAMIDGAQAVLAYPVIDVDPAIGDFVAELRLACGPTPVATPIPPSTSTPTATPTATPTPAAACALAPRNGCQPPRRSSAISLHAAARRVRWRWRNGSAPVTLSQFGDPVAGPTLYHLCVYDTGAGPLTLAFHATVRAGGTCGLRPCWKQARSRFSYVDAAATADGVSRMTLRADGSTGTTISVNGRGANLHPPVSADGVFLLREFPQVIVQLQRSDSPACWEAVFTGPPMRDTRWVFADSVR